MGQQLEVRDLGRDGRRRLGMEMLKEKEWEWKEKVGNGDVESRGVGMENLREEEWKRRRMGMERLREEGKRVDRLRKEGWGG